MKNIPVRQLNKSKKEPDFFEAFSIRKTEEILAGIDMVQDLHRHDHFYILALKKGMGNHEIDFIKYKIEDDIIFFMRPGQVHQIKLNSKSTGYLMQFKAEFYYPNDKTSSQLLNKVSSKNVCQLDARKIKKLFEILNYVFEEYSEKQEGYQEIIKANLGIFFTELVRHRQNRKIITTTNIYSQDRLDELLYLIETNYITHRHVSQYAEMMNLSTFQLNAITKTTLGKSCSQILNEYIVLEAKRNLLSSGSLVGEIAYLLGYEDVSYFIRFFKKHTGYSPDAFRNNFK